MYRSIAIGAFVFAAISFAVAWRAHHAPGAASTIRTDVATNKSEHKQSTTRAPTPQVIAPKRMNSVTRIASQYTTIAPKDRPDLIAAEVRTAADSGDPEAMRVLGQTFSDCAKLTKGSDDQFEMELAKRSIDADYLREKKNLAVRDDAETQSTDRGLTKSRALRDACRKISSEDIGHSREWLKRSSEAGDSLAGEALAFSYLSDSRDPDKLAEERDTARENALDIAQNEIANGNCSNTELQILKTYSNDPMLIYIYGSILNQRILAHLSDLPQENRQRSADMVSASQRRYEAALAPYQVEAARQSFDDVLRNYCST